MKEAELWKDQEGLGACGAFDACQLELCILIGVNTQSGQEVVTRFGCAFLTLVLSSP